MAQKYNVAVAGATGAVGREMLSILEERDFPVDQVFALASKRSVGKEISYGEKKVLKVEVLEDFDFAKADFVLASCGGRLSKEYAPKATAAGAIFIDNSSQFRMDPEVPLVVPEVNGHVLDGFRGKIIANPNCSTIQMVLALSPLHKAAELLQVQVSTYQSVSGAGKVAMDELFDQTRGVFMNQPRKKQVFTKEISFNVIPHIDTFQQNGQTREEGKMREETRKILDTPVQITAFCVRVPVFIGHALAVFAFFAKPLTPSRARQIFRSASGIFVIDSKIDGGYVTPKETAGQDNAYISRIHQHPDDPKGLIFWVAADNLRKGAALNAVQIAEYLIGKKG